MNERRRVKSREKRISGLKGMRLEECGLSRERARELAHREKYLRPRCTPYSAGRRECNGEELGASEQTICTSEGARESEMEERWKQIANTNRQQ